MLHSLRRRLQESAERESAGESLWTEEFSERTRTRILHILTRTVGAFTITNMREVAGSARSLILEQEGLDNLAGNGNPEPDFLTYVRFCPHDMFPTVVEASIMALAYA